MPIIKYLIVKIVFRGERYNVYFCDGYLDEMNLCSENGCRDVTMDGITAEVCCCDWEL